MGYGKKLFQLARVSREIDVCSINSLEPNNVHSVLPLMTSRRDGEEAWKKHLNYTSLVHKGDGVWGLMMLLAYE